MLHRLWGCAGETIVETLVSILISALALTMLATVVGTAVNVIRSNRDYLEDYYSNESAMVESLSSSSSLLAGSSTGSAAGDPDEGSSTEGGAGDPAEGETEGAAEDATGDSAEPRTTKISIIGVPLYKDASGPVTDVTVTVYSTGSEDDAVSLYEWRRP